MKKRAGIKKRLLVIFQSLVLVALGVGAALGLMELLLRANPELVPGTVRVSPPVRRVRASVDETYEVKLSNGDLFYWMAGRVMPLLPGQDRVVAEVHLTTDEHGFRNVLPEQDNYDVVALGDSFTVAGNVAAPWPHKLADYTGMAVFNLGDAGIGPQEEVALLQEYGLAKRPQWVIMAYFEGNDLYDAAAYEQATPFIVARVGRYMLTEGMKAWQDVSDNPAQAATPNYIYPITVTVNHHDLEMAFFSAYITWSSVRDDLIQSSQNYHFVQEAILEVRELSEAANAHFLLVYVPTKEHIYLPCLNDADTLARIFSDVPALQLDEDGFLQFTNQKATAEQTRQHLDDQARLLADFAAEQNIAFLDLTPHFQAETATGLELYYPYDTHWNQQGHDLAAQTIGQYIQGKPARPVNELPCR